MDPPPKGHETLWNPASAAHFMRRGSGRWVAFRFGANPAGWRRDLLFWVGERLGALPPWIPRQRVMRPFGIPLLRRILCAAVLGDGLRFDSGQIPPDGGVICCFGLGGTFGGAAPLDPPPKGLRPFGIPLLRRILCAAVLGDGLRFDLGQIPPGGGVICCFGLGNVWGRRPLGSPAKGS